MAWGIRISEDDFDVKTTPTSSNKKRFVFLSDDNSPKVLYAGFLEEASPGAGITYTHGLGYVPMHFLFIVDSISSPTYFQASNNVKSSTSAITSTSSKVYLIILVEGT
jgi:hypothetical protein